MLLDGYLNNEREKAALAGALTDWFGAAMRPLPWRRDYQPYSVWISEIMLQQTQMERGVRYYNRWMERFPAIESVAVAGEEEILAAWEGLGYYSRARNLHAAAKEILARHGGIFPRTVEAIRSLPGVGEYTAGAIASIAFNLPEPAVDANVLRIVARLADMEESVAGSAAREAVAGLVRSILPHTSPRLFNQALMEFGALVCGRTPACAGCPLAAFCRALHRGTVALRPVKPPKAAPSRLDLATGILLRNGRALIRQRPRTGLWGGLWEFPCAEVGHGETPVETVARIFRECGMPVRVGRKIASVHHGYTTWKVTLHGFFCHSPENAAPGLPDGEYRWVAPEEFVHYAFPAGHRKLLEGLGWKTTGDG